MKRERRRKIVDDREKWIREAEHSLVFPLMTCDNRMASFVFRMELVIIGVKE